jgi:hypothetical protein
MHLISLAALVLTATPPAASNAEPAARPTLVAQAATATTVRRNRYEPAGMVVQGGTTPDEDALAQQQTLHVLMPARSGDGGG